jgi:hypothetical protein
MNTGLPKAFVADGYRQFMEREMSKVARKQFDIENKAVDALYVQIYKLGYGKSTIVPKSELKYDNTTRTFSGNIQMKASIFDKGEKTLSIPVTIQSNIIKLPDNDIVKKQIMTTQSSFEADIKPLMQSIDSNKYKVYDEYIQKKELELNDYLDNKPKEVQASTDVPQSTVASTLHISKLALPQSTQKEDIIEIDGVTYKVSGEGAGGAIWILKLMENK